MIDLINSIEYQAITKIKNVKNTQELENIRIHYLGKNGKLISLIKLLSKIPDTEKPLLGKAINNAKKQITYAIYNNTYYNKKLSKIKKIYTTIDTTLAGVGQNIGSLHPITTSLQKIQSIFNKMHFTIQYGNEIENEYYNFEALNISKNHPSRNKHDTFYINSQYVLRTHTSGIQIRTMENTKIPIQIISPGKVYRRDLDITHTPMFHQVEGLWIDKKISFTDLFGILDLFLKNFFNTNSINIRFRPSYFPFTEPSAEVDMSCIICKNQGCRICKYTGWIEIIGCGIVHPKVMQKNNINKDCNGIAFGIGVERLAMLYYKINDLRLFFENDLKFLKQF